MYTSIFGKVQVVNYLSHMCVHLKLKRTIKLVRELLRCERRNTRSPYLNSVLHRFIVSSDYWLEVDDHLTLYLVKDSGILISQWTEEHTSWVGISDGGHPKRASNDVVPWQYFTQFSSRAKATPMLRTMVVKTTEVFLFHTTVHDLSLIIGFHAMNIPRVVPDCFQNSLQNKLIKI